MLISMPFFSSAQAVLPSDTTKRVIVRDSLEEEQTLEHKIIYNAKDSARYEDTGNKLFLFGDAYVEYENMSIKSEFIEIDYSKNLVNT